MKKGGMERRGNTGSGARFANTLEEKGSNNSGFVEFDIRESVNADQSGLAVQRLGSKSVSAKVAPRNIFWYQHPLLWAYLLSFLYTMLCGFAVSLIIWCPSYVLAYALQQKSELLTVTARKHGVGMSVLYSALYAVGFTLIAAGFPYMFGTSIAGSGLPGLISYIRCGRKSSRAMMTMKTAILKSIALVCAVLSGLPVGREGPSIQIGAATSLYIGRKVRYFVQYLVNLYPWMHTKLESLQVGDFRTHFSGEFEHEVIHIGAASGFAGAFGSPLAAHMFIYEEVASHWPASAKMGARVFFGSAITLVGMQMLRGMLTGDGELQFQSIIVYDLNAKDSLDASWWFADAPFVILLGLLTGSISCLMMYLGDRVFRFHHGVKEPKWRVLDAVVISVLCSSCMCLLPVIAPQCHLTPPASTISTIQHGFAQFDCDPGYYNEIGSLAVGSPEDVIRHMFSRDDRTRFALVSLVLFGIVYTFLFIASLGLCLPAGNFVPNMLIGGISGRIVGELADLAYKGRNIRFSSPGVFAILGSTGQLCAWTRCMASIVVCMFEVTSDVSLTIPMVVVAVLARSISAIYKTESWTHTLLHMMHLPVDKVPPQAWKDDKTTAAKHEVGSSQVIDEISRVNDSDSDSEDDDDDNGFDHDTYFLDPVDEENEARLRKSLSEFEMQNPLQVQNPRRLNSK